MAETTLSHISAAENEGHSTNQSNVTHGRNTFHTPIQQPMPGQPLPLRVPHENITAYGLPLHMPSLTPPPPPPGPSSSGPHRYPSWETTHADLHSHGSPYSNFQGLPPPQQLLLEQPSSQPHLGPYQQPPIPRHGQHGLMSQIQDPVPPCQFLSSFDFQEQQQQQHSWQDGQLATVPNQSNPNPPHHHPPDMWQTNIPNNGPQQGQAYNTWEHSRMSGSFQQPPPLLNKSRFPLRPPLTSQNSGQPCQRLQSYQSYRIRSKTPENKPSDLTQSQNQAWLNGHKPNLEGINPIMPLSDKFKTEQKEEESQDQKWVKNWVKGRQKSELLKDERNKLEIRLGEIVQMIKELRTKRDKAEDCLLKDADDGHWKNRFRVMKEQMIVLSSLQNEMRSPGFVEGMKKQVERQQIKRERKRRSRQEVWEDRKKTLRLQNELVDDSMAKALQVKQDKEKEEALQKEVDNILAEVHKKKQDVNKTMDLLRALSKLRSLRKEAAEKKGFRGPEDLDVLFEGKVCGLEEMVNRQKLLYVEEERALQVMLEEEHEETREKERQKKQKKERQQVEKAWKEELQLLFGETERIELGHPLFMSRQFYMQGEYDTQALINIRRQWDAFLVPERDPEGSSIPLSWVLPQKPANHIWETALEDTPGT